ncbi:PREDICTED: ras-related and estrogen-regulated growth inhibitor-like [Priapulus caudatus]|uniref:small monomeric GTPase n=1 Tax=Priapulus caudatus TaxID=37621 RepID=A0ABM1DVK4_PRICU|nr:PREDICTED: ras-related and estrogen-regulated growth inhibitor-like [Priapulus caudatus]
MAVRFVTRRFIGEYDPTLERIYSVRTEFSNEPITFDILDTAGQEAESSDLHLQENIRWADAYVLVYSVTDKCSFDECTRLKFLITHMRRRRKLSYGHAVVHPVVLVGNKSDQVGDRMVGYEDGRRRSVELGCNSFHEISVRESGDDVRAVFADVYEHWRGGKRTVRISRANTVEEPPTRASVTGLLASFRSKQTTAASPTPADGARLASGLPRARLNSSVAHALPRNGDTQPAATSVASPRRRMSVSLQGTSDGADA